MYFDHEAHPNLDTPRSSFVGGYGHCFVFASAAAVGAGLVVAVSHQQELTEDLGDVLANTATTVPVAFYLIAVAALRAHQGRPRIIPWSVGGAAALVVAASILPVALYVTAGVLSALVAVLIVSTRARVNAAG